MKLLLVDGSALLHRAYHAYPPLTSKTGEIVGAVYGVASILISALENVEPSHVMVAWDLPKPTFRHVKYVGYKAQRPKADEEMVQQIPKVKEIIASMGIVQVEQEGYEADDILGTLATQVSRDKFQIPNSNLQTNSNNQIQNSKQVTEVIILTGDQDTMQLVSENVRVLTPAKGANQSILYGPDEVFNKYGVYPEQIVDYKALIGDASDNIPGVSGIGPKGAAELIGKFSSLEGIYQNLTKIPLNQRIKLETGKESAFLSQDLSRIVTDMKLSVQIEEMKCMGLQGESPSTSLGTGLKKKLEELGFKSLVKRIWNDPTSPKGSEGARNQMGLF